MELTREQLEKLANPTMLEATYEYKNCFVAELAKQLLAEMDKPKVWVNAPDKATIAKVHFYKREKVYARPDGTPEVYTRELPKSPEREIAEKYADKWDIHCDSTEQRRVADVIESAINEYKESVK